MKDLISIIIPVYNVEQYLKRCIDSILNQTYHNLEIILVDDGSPDNCPQLCDEFAIIDTRIKVLHKQNGGLSSARLAGFNVATGDYILFIDSDDYIEKNMVEELVTATAQTNSDMAVCGYYTQFGEQKKENLLPYSTNVLQGKDEITQKYIVYLIGKDKNKVFLPGFLCIRLLKKSLIRNEFFVSENEFFAEDVVFDLLYSDNIQKITIVKKPLYNYCVNEQSLSNKYRKNKWQMLKNLHEFKKDFLARRNIYDDENRLQDAIQSSIFSSVDNAVLSGSYNCFLKEIKQIEKDVKYMGSFIDINLLHGTVALTMMLFKFRLYPILYAFRKSRLKK